MIVQLASDFACDVKDIFAISKNADKTVRIVFRDARHQDLVIYSDYDQFILDFQDGKFDWRQNDDRKTP
jgi:hypothetical protein